MDSVRKALHYIEKNLGWVALPNAFAGGMALPIQLDPEAEVVPRCRALRLPEVEPEPPFEEYMSPDTFL